MKTSYSLTPSFTVLQYNLCEARTTELTDLSNTRIDALAKEILKLTNGRLPDFASFNELQYDTNGCPTRDYTSIGLNLTTLYQRIHSLSNISEDIFDTKTAFHPGNCGEDHRAIKMSNGDYCNSRNATVEEKFAYGDRINCLATLPGQYGVGFWSKYTVVDFRVISKLKWKDFNPSIDLTTYCDQKGDPLPDDTTLFDKCCMVVKVDMQGKLINFVVLHLMPAYAFGIEKSANILRNKDQLAFLEWLLIKNTDLKPPEILDDEGKIILPIPADETVIAMGDLNVDSRRSDPGAQHLINIYDDPKYHVFPWHQTTEISPNGETLQLDYMISGGNAITARIGSELIGRMDPENLSDHAPIVATFDLV